MPSISIQKSMPGGSVTGFWPSERGKVRGVGPIWRVTTIATGMRRRVSNYISSLRR